MPLDRRKGVLVGTNGVTRFDKIEPSNLLNQSIQFYYLGQELPAVVRFVYETIAYPNGFFKQRWVIEGTPRVR
jgi:hypothetical protein